MARKDSDTALLAGIAILALAGRASAGDGDNGDGGNGGGGVDNSPTADFTTSNVVLDDPDPTVHSGEMTVDATATTDDGQIVEYRWELRAQDEGELKTFQIATESVPNKTFTDLPGRDYHVYLRVTDDAGQEDSITKRVDLRDTANMAPSADFTTSVESSDAMAGTRTIKFDGSLSSDPDGTIQEYSWDLEGRDTSSFVTSIIRVDVQPGTHTMTLTVTDDSGMTGSVTKTFTVDPFESNNPPVAVAQASADSGGNVTLNGSDSSDPDGDTLLYTWRVEGEGITDFYTGETVSTFYSPGSYTATLTVEDGDGASDSDSASFTISDGSNGGNGGGGGTDPLTANFKYDREANDLLLTDTSTLTDTEDSITTYSWDVDRPDGSSTFKTGEVADIDLRSTGTYTVRHSVATAFGDFAEVTKDIQVSNVETQPVAAYEWSVSDGVLSVDASDSYDPDGTTIVSYDWTVSWAGGNLSGSGVTETFTLSEPEGVPHQVTLTLTTADGATDSHTEDSVNTSVFQKRVSDVEVDPGGPILEAKVFTSTALDLKTDGHRPGEETAVNYLVDAFARAGINYDVRYGYSSYEAACESSVHSDAGGPCGCENGAVCDWGDEIKSGQIVLSDLSTTTPAKDTNILLVDSNFGGRGSLSTTGPGYCVVGAGPVMQTYTYRREANLDNGHRLGHTVMHEVGHNFGIKHKPHRGRAWNDEIEQVWKRTPTVGSNGVENACGEWIPERNYDRAVRICDYADCARTEIRKQIR